MKSWFIRMESEDWSLKLYWIKWICHSSVKFSTFGIVLFNLQCEVKYWSLYLIYSNLTLWLMVMFYNFYNLMVFWNYTSHGGHRLERLEKSHMAIDTVICLLHCFTILHMHSVPYWDKTALVKNTMPKNGTSWSTDCERNSK